MILVLGLVAFVASASALYSPSDAVVDLNPSNFNSKVIQSDELWIVEFYAPWCGHCKSLAPEYKKAAKALKGVVNIGAVDADAHNSLGGQYGVRGFPTIKVFGANKNNPEDYNGPRTAQGIVDTAMGKLKTLVSQRLSGGGSSGGGSGSGGSGGAGNKEDVITLTDSNFDKLVYGSEDMWLIEFYAPWCGHCKNLAPHWQAAATQLKGKVKLGAVDATENTILGQKFGIQMFPTIFMFGPGKKHDDMYEQYEGERSTEDIVRYSLEKLAEYGPPPEVQQVRGYPTIKFFPAGKRSGPDDAEEYDGGRTTGDIVSWATDKYSSNLPPPEVKELLNAEQLKTTCESNQLCVIAFMPHILDCQSECRNGYIKILQNMAEKYKKRQWGYLWAEAGAQSDLEEAVGIGGFGYPAMAAINSRKMKYAWLRGSFSESGVAEFLRDLAMGRGSTAPVKNNELPKVRTSEPWDGKDGEMPVEEDIDLSDVELDDLDDVKEEL